MLLLLVIITISKHDLLCFAVAKLAVSNPVLQTSFARRAQQDVDGLECEGH